MRFYILLLFLSSFFHSFGQAQFQSGGQGYLAGGLAYQNAEYLKENQAPSLPRARQPLLGYRLAMGGWALFSNDVIALAEVHMSFMPELENEVGTLRYSSSSGHIGLGYALWNRENALIFPKAAFGLTEQRLLLRNESGQVQPFGSTALAADVPQEVFLQDGLYIELGLQIHRLFRWRDLPKGPTVGLGLSYRLGLNSYGWSRSGQDSPLAEGGRRQGFYLQLMLGFGSYKPQPN